ncbi:hypothetical protein DEJ53_00910 [Weissella confusa]|uniref:hypothetical protein n=1 Tax=Weissella confusa TaxID=1583 RepID=UPI000DCA52C5|nr:hypothetical protein [Weissella confusa]RAU09058.1 hypothetical protein DEJ53_00910 [Weissella confusa]
MLTRRNQKCEKPAYITHESTENDITIDWFFGKGRLITKIWQALLAIIGMFFMLLPVYITVKTMIAKYIQKGHAIWSYTEGFKMWEFATKFFMDMALFFVIIFFVLYLINQYREKRDQDALTVDANRVAYRVSLAEEMYDTKYGPQAFRTNRQSIRVVGYDDVETYELRDRFKYFEIADGDDYDTI